MTTSNNVTLNNIYNFFSLTKEVEKIDVAPTATGGLGINNLDAHPPPQPNQRKKRMGTEYAQKFIEEDKREVIGRQTLDLPEGSTISLTDLEEPDDLSTCMGEILVPPDLEMETTHEIYSTYYRTKPNVRYNSELAITAYRGEILNHLDINPVVIIQGNTGCGKTTQVPQFILDHHAARGTYCNIIVTQPRKLAAISIAKRVSQERQWQLGTIIGYQVAMDNRTSPDTRLSYVTTGVLLQKLVQKKRMDMYTHVILDEVHERDQDTDFSLLVVKKLLKSNSRRVKVVLMSATFDTSIFAKYFSSMPSGYPAPIIDVIGKSKEVTEHYLRELTALGVSIPEFDPGLPMVHKELYDLVVKLMFVFDKIEKSEQGVSPDKDYAPFRGAVLIFLPGYDEILSMKNKLDASAFNRKFQILPLHSTVTVEEQSKVFAEAPAEHRKVIISTNIAESSITVPDIRYVVDFCLTKSLVADPDTNYCSLQLEWASKANCTQRKGRAGRVDVGRCYRLLDRNFYDQHLPAYTTPEMQRCPLTQTVLAAKKLDLGEPPALLALALDPPALSDIENAILELKEALALTVGHSTLDGELTFIGQVMASLPLDVRLSKLIIFGFVFNCLEDCIIIAASLSLKNFLAQPFNKFLEAYKSRLAWADGTFSDCLAFLNAYRTWKHLLVQGQFRRPGGLTEEEWGRRNYVQIRRIRMVDQLVKELKNRLLAFDMAVDPERCSQREEAEILVLQVVMAGAFFPNYYFQEPLDEETVLRTINNNDPCSTVLVTGLPPDQGLLYACALRDMLVGCGTKMNIEFEGQKAYVCFEKGQADASVLPAVYLACKLRQRNKPLELVEFEKDEAQQKMEQIRRLKQSPATMSSLRFSVRLSARQLKKPHLPPIDTLFEHILITHVVNCGHFWARYFNPDANNQLQFLDTTINIQQGKNLQRLKGAPEPDTLLLAPYAECANAQPMYYRALVTEVHHKQAKVFFVDYGNVEYIKLDALREIDENLKDIGDTPALAFECYLSEVKPSSKNAFGQWTQPATEWFKRIVSGNPMRAKIYSVVQDTVRLELNRARPDGSFESLNRMLLAKGEAEHAEESFASKQDHELRVQWDAYQEACPGEAFPCAEFSLEEIRPLGLRTTSRRRRLHGPHSPLEVQYAGLSRRDRYKACKVERDSVNSVSLNGQPHNSCPRFLVASTATLNQRSDTLSLRSTTLMPHLRCLPPLVCLLFAPYAELQCNKNQTAYTGVLCGLGFDPVTKQPLHPDHEVELVFDTEISVKDICDVNSMRTALNLVLASKRDLSNWSFGGIKKVHKSLREQLQSLLERKRESRTAEVTLGYEWQRLPSSELLSADLGSDFVLPLHKGIKLRQDASLQAELREHIAELCKKLEKPPKEFQYTRCRLCAEGCNTHRDLLTHLNEPSHLRREKQLFPTERACD